MRTTLGRTIAIATLSACHGGHRAHHVPDPTAPAGAHTPPDQVLTAAAIAIPIAPGKTDA